MDRLREILAILANQDALGALSDEEVGALETELLGLFDQVRAGDLEGVARGDLETLEGIVGGVEQVRGEASVRLDAAAESAEQVAALEARLAGETDAGETDSTDATAETGDQGDSTDATTGTTADTATATADTSDTATADADTADQATADAPVAVAAAGQPRPTVSQLLGRSNRRQPRPTARVVSEPQQFRLADSDQFISADELTERMIAVARQFGNIADGVSIKRPIASVATRPADAPRLNADSAEGVTRQIDRILAEARERDGSLVGLTAAGGWGAPAEVDYGVDSISVADRPVRDALPSLTAARGAWTFVTPPLYTAVLKGQDNSAGHAAGVWPAAMDATPQSNTKGLQIVPNPTTHTETVDALYVQSQVGNLLNRAFPEWIRAWMQNTRAAQAQVAEEYLLAKIDANCTALTHTTEILGVTRELPVALINLAAQERRRHRANPTMPVVVLLPTTVLDLVQIDVMRSGVNFMDGPPQTVARTFFDTMLATANIRAAYYYDDDAIPEAQGAGAMHDLHTHINVRFFHEGAFVHLDDGVLDLGVYRDASLISTNDFRMFFESFEGLAYRGHFAYKLGMEVAANGTASAATDIHTHFLSS